MECPLYELLIYAVCVFIIYTVLDKLVRLPLLSFKDKHVLITGCDTGFGYGAAILLDKKGCCVHAACLTNTGVEKLTDICSDRMHAFQMDIRNHDSVIHGFKEVKQYLPIGRGLWGIINNAGVMGKTGPMEWLKVKDFQEVLDVNLLGMVDVTDTFLSLVKIERGRIVNTASMLGRTALLGTAPYCCSKYAVEAYSDILRRQLREFDVSVHIIEPGFFKTNLSNVKNFEATFDDTWNNCSQEVKKEYGIQYLEQTKANANEFLTNIVSKKTDEVILAYEHALFGCWPRPRYLIGYDARLLFIPVQALPERLGDILHDLLNYNKPIPDACKKKYT